MEKWKKRKKVQGARWRRLDNTGKLFAMVTGEDLSNVFRVSAVLKETVDPERLRLALIRTLPEFDAFRVKLRRGFFWNYFETNTREPAVEEETPYPCRLIEPHGNEMYLFRVSYFGNRINLEVFHALTDGMGAMNFLKRLVEQYLEPEEGKQSVSTDGENSEKQGNSVQEVIGADDRYLTHYRRIKHTGYERKRAFQLKGKRLPLGETSVFHGYADLEKLKHLCRQEKVSITKYLTALLLWSIIQTWLDGETKDCPVAVNLPINLRAGF